MAKKKTDDISHILNTISHSLSQQNSLRRVFLVGLVRGLGTTLGATVLLAIATSITIKLVGVVDLNTLMQQFFDSAI